MANPPNPHHEIFKFQIGPGQGKMTDPQPSLEHFYTSDLAWTWKYALIPPLLPDNI